VLKEMSSKSFTGTWTRGNGNVNVEFKSQPGNLGNIGFSNENSIEWIPAQSSKFPVCFSIQVASNPKVVGFLEIQNLTKNGFTVVSHDTQSGIFDFSGSYKRSMVLSKNHSLPIVSDVIPSFLSIMDTGTTITVSGGGLGAVAGAIFTLPPGSVSTVEFTVNVMTFSAQDMANIQSFVKGALTASQYSSYEDDTQKSAAASWSLWGGASASASASETTKAMSGYGLAPADQSALLKMIANMVPKPGNLHFKSVITNSFDNQVSGNVYLYTFTGNITSSSGTTSAPMTGGALPVTTDGNTLPIKTTITQV
jgi:hypothetical protein